MFILRRTQALLAKHLPPLTSLTLFCKPSEQQVGLYTAVLRSKAVASLLHGAGGGGEDNTLAIITALRKVGTARPPKADLEPTMSATCVFGDRMSERRLLRLQQSARWLRPLPKRVTNSAQVRGS